MSHRSRVVQQVPSLPVYGYQAMCEDCGEIGQPQVKESDAQAIANRHEGMHR